MDNKRKTGRIRFLALTAVVLIFLAGLSSCRPLTSGLEEDQEQESGSSLNESEMTCTLLVECSTILNQMDELTKGKESLVPSDGIIYSEQEVHFQEGESVYDILLREMQSNQIHMDSEYTPVYESVYVKGINNLYEFDCGRWSGWMYCVNGEYPNYGCSKYEVQEGDTIEWHFTCDLGRDLGRDMSEYETESEGSR